MISETQFPHPVIRTLPIISQMRWKRSAVKSQIRAIILRGVSSYRDSCCCKVH
jgi:hypothetical protein